MDCNAAGFTAMEAHKLRDAKQGNAMKVIFYLSAALLIGALSLIAYLFYVSMPYDKWVQSQRRKSEKKRRKE